MSCLNPLVASLCFSLTKGYELNFLYRFFRWFDPGHRIGFSRCEAFDFFLLGCHQFSYTIRVTNLLGAGLTLTYIISGRIFNFFLFFSFSLCGIDHLRIKKKNSSLKKIHYRPSFAQLEKKILTRNTRFLICSLSHLLTLSSSI